MNLRPGRVKNERKMNFPMGVTMGKVGSINGEEEGKVFILLMPKI
jgi:hypothetical protein